MASRSYAISLLCVLLGTYVSQASANTFLARNTSAMGVGGDKEDLLSGLRRVLGEGHVAVVEGHAELLKEALRPTFHALGRGGRLPADSVRYLLHRLFVDRHGWFVNGLDVGGEAWNSSSPAEVFKCHDDEVYSLFEERLSSNGFSLDEVAVLAATLESFVRLETTERLRSAFRLEGLSEAATSASEAKVREAIDTYMIIYLIGLNHTTADTWVIEANKRAIHDIYPTWDTTHKWVHDVRAEVLAALDSSASPTSFNTTVRVLEEVADRYGRWQDLECQDLKTSLIKMEDRDTGRVRLDAFYRSALDGNWQFSESIDYLRQLGALDETEPSRPSVMISNYVNAPSNCLASSKFYSVCCISECEALLGSLERHIAAPEASPTRIAELVSSMPSSTVLAPRSLPASLVGRLEEIASQHGGKVPFHTRLFAQWLHHAYPRECPYPQLAGTSKPTPAQQWEDQTGRPSVVDNETMLWHIDVMWPSRGAAGPADAGGENTSVPQLPWSAEEELYVTRPTVQEPPMAGRRCLVGLVFAAVAVSLVLSLARTAVNAGHAAAASPKKYHV